MEDISTAIIAATKLLDTGSVLLESAAGFLAKFTFAIVAISAFAAKHLPPPENPGLMAKIHKVINLFGQNSGYAENINNNEASK